MKIVVDTNVLLVANGQHQDASEDCVIECVQRLLDAKNGACVCLDDGYRILGEYQQKTSLVPQKGPGDAFLKWLLQNGGNVDRVEHVTLSEPTADVFDEFPGMELQELFDPPDRKFAAVANAHPEKPDIWQAVDCKWLNWHNALALCGVRTVFLCPDDVCKFYARKFPDAPIPDVLLR